MCHHKLKNLSWSDHVNSLCKRVKSKLYLLRKSFSNISFDVPCKLYYSYVRPILEYAGSVWCPNLIQDQQSLEGVQRSATRLPM